VQKSLSLADLKKSLQYVISIDWQHHVVTENNFLYKG